MRTESDAFRYYTSEGLDALDSTTKAFGLVNRFIDMQDSVPAMGDTDTNAAFKNRVPAGRADGMVIVAHEAVESSTNSRTRKKYKGVTYDTDENVQVQQGRRRRLHKDSRDLRHRCGVGRLLQRPVGRQQPGARPRRARALLRRHLPACLRERPARSHRGADPVALRDPRPVEELRVAPCPSGLQPADQGGS
ncbi:MAG: hypothetical protein ACLTDR_06115 [Adlercreutzia equolifaciens]